MFDLIGKKALVTGATQGIGFAIAKALAQCGAKVYVNGASSLEKCMAASEKVNNSTPVCVNLGNDTCSEEIYEITGDVDILVLNASIQFRKSWNEITSDEFDKQMKVNFKSSLELIQKYVPYMKENKWGRILTIGSVQQYKPHKDMVVYAASKMAQVSMVNNLAKQLAPYGITVNNLAPGVIATPRNFDALSDAQYSQQVLSGIPLGYAGEPKDCTAGALLLCSDEGRYITGIDLPVDGGMHL